MNPQAFRRFSYAAIAFPQRLFDQPPFRGGREAFQITAPFKHRVILRHQILLIIGRGRRRREDQLVIPADDEDAFHDIAQLPDIARPIVAQHGLDGYRRERLLCVILFVQLAQEALCQRQDILPSLSERWQLDEEYAEAIIKILAEPMLFYHILQVHVGGADDPRVDGDIFDTADTTNLPIFKRTQKL